MRPDDALQDVKRAFDAGRMAHAYVIAGAPRSEGQPLAERILQLLVCGRADRPCGICPACRHVRERARPDFLWVEPQKKSRVISIEQVRDLQHRMQQTAYAGPWKGCVIMGADRLGREASNAFLKTLEEPPGQALFLLLSDAPQFLLPTIRSRCQYISLSGGAAGNESWREELLDILSGVAGPSGKAGRPSALAVFARTDRLVRLLKALKLACEEAEKANSAESGADEDADTVNARASARYRESRSALMRGIQEWYRDALLLVCKAGEESLCHRDRVETLTALAATLDYRRAIRNVEIVEGMNRQLEMNLPEALVLSSGFAEMAV